jgi:hypothetical protein
MRRGLNFYILLVFTVFVKLAWADCANGQSVNSNLYLSKDINISARSCGDDEDGGVVYMTITIDGSSKKTADFKYTSQAYVLSLRTDIYFEGNQGIGVSTGAGRDGDGMHYWMLAEPGYDLVDLGDAPNIQVDQFSGNSYSALVSSDGSKYQSIRYFYSVVNNKIVPEKAIGFNFDGGGYNVTLMSVNANGDFDVRYSKGVSRREYISCQNGKIDCW